MIYPTPVKPACGKKMVCVHVTMPADQQAISDISAALATDISVHNRRTNNHLITSRSFGYSV
jgi:hypothetical protein